MKTANKVANVLKSLGVESQDRVGLRLTNTPDSVAINFGIQKLGAIPVPISPLWAKEEIEFTLNNAEFAAFFVSAPLLAAVEAGNLTSKVPNQAYSLWAVKLTKSKPKAKLISPKKWPRRLTLLRM